MAHSELSPSNAHRWMNCPGSVALARKAPKPVPSKWAEEGTNAHKCLEYLLRRFGSMNRRIKEELQRSWPAEMVGHALKAVETVKGLRPSEFSKLYCEQEISLTHLSDGMKGTLDAAWAEEFGQLVAIDFKYGAGVEVSPKEENGEPNPQLMSYAVGVARKHEYNFESVTLAIIQPRIWNAEEGGLSKATFPIESLQVFEAKLKTAAEKTRAKNAALCAGSWCTFCPAASICPEISTKALAKTGVVFDVEHGVEATPDPKALTPKMLGKILPACEQIETWINEVRTQAFTRAERGEKIEGYKLVNKRSTRVWLPKAEALARKKWGKAAYSEPEFLSPAQLEKSFGKEAKLFTERFTSDVTSGVTLVKESDPRAEVSSVIVFDTKGAKETVETDKTTKPKRKK